MHLPSKAYKPRKLAAAFYLRDDVVTIAKELLGKILVTDFDGKFTSGRIVETEAYAGEIDRASHAFKGRTPRTSVMFNPGGHAYIYLCYGIHQMFNVVTGPKDLPHAILIRGVEPLQGIEHMLERTGKNSADRKIASGPGNVGKAFGFHTSQTGLTLTGKHLYIADDGIVFNNENIICSPRIGVAYAGDHARWDYRFTIKGNPHVSGKNISR